MVPSESDPKGPLIQALERATIACRGRPLETFYAGYTGDAGRAASLGVPPVEFGPEAHGEVDRPTGTEFISLSQVKQAARIYAHVILDLLR
jgi:acetylornithine deacetylase/succinyl-diaminopimelate desuccinylase-like protein